MPSTFCFADGVICSSLLVVFERMSGGHNFRRQVAPNSRDAVQVQRVDGEVY